MRILVTGADGFIGRNLRQHLAVRRGVQVVPVTRDTDPASLPSLVDGVDFVAHLAGVNRPKSADEFVMGNVDVTAALVDAIAGCARRTGARPPVFYASSTQAEFDNPYGRSKLAGALALQRAMERRWNR